MIPIVFARSSLLNQWSYCQQATYLTYGLGLQSPSGAKAVYGTISHKALEIFAVAKKAIQDNPKKKKITFKDDEIGEFTFNVKDLLSESFYGEIMERAYNHYKTNNSHFEWNDKKDYKFCKQMVDNCLAYNEGQYDPRKVEIFSPEQSFNFSLDDQEWAHFEYEGQKYVLELKGTMDLLVKESEDTLHLWDFKTGQRKDWSTGEVKTEEKLQRDLQLLMYYYCTCKLFPQFKYIMVTILFLRDGGPYSICFDTSDHEKFLKELKRIIKEMHNCKLPKPINKWRSDFRCTRLCHFYKNNWPGTETPMCNYVEDYVKTYGITKANKELKREGFTTAYYQAPGST